MRVLIVEDDPVLADGLVQSLRRAGYAVDHVGNGVEALHAVEGPGIELMILDVGLPRMDGFAVLKSLRSRGNALPVLMLTARDGVEDRVRGLDLGADDYLVKPFSLPELEARVRALLRRGQAAVSPVIVQGSLCFDTNTRQVSIDGAVVELSAREVGVLETLLTRIGRVVTKEQLIEGLYSLDQEASGNAIEVYIHRLRRKIEPAGIVIRTVRGLGYLIDRPS